MYHIAVVCATQLTVFEAEEAQKSVRGLGENAIHQKYVELVCEVRYVVRSPCSSMTSSPK